FGGWALVAAGISEGILTSILSCLGPLSAAAAVAGLIIMIIIMSKHEDPPDPLRDFVNTQASNAGLKMPEGAEIDYIDVIPDIEGKSYDGISMRNGNRYLLMKLPEAQAVMGDLVHDATSVFFILTDENGISQIFTYLPDGKGNTVTVYLGVDDQGNAMAKEFPAPPEKQPDGTYKPGEMDAYQKKVRQMHWECKCTGNVSIYKQGDDKSLFFANFSLKNQESQKYLIMDGSSVVTGDVKQDWTLSMEQIGPGALTYHPNPLKIYTDSRDHKLIPSFNICGSSPLTWKITPALDNAFELLTSGDYQGIIRQKPGIAPHEMADTNYKVTVSNTISGALYSSTCDITIHVDRPENTGPSPKKFIVLTPERLRLESVGV
ncbi:MAG TPA: hypothetical protein VHT34_12410, partial [Clostridia bacterium]|nr:hypothetical protein [Clostridia bacterium]